MSKSPLLHLAAFAASLAISGAAHGQPAPKPPASSAPPQLLETQAVPAAGAGTAPPPLRTPPPGDEDKFTTHNSTGTQVWVTVFQDNSVLEARCQGDAAPNPRIAEWTVSKSGGPVKVRVEVAPGCVRPVACAREFARAPGMAALEIRAAGPNCSVQPIQPPANLKAVWDNKNVYRIKNNTTRTAWVTFYYGPVPFRNIARTGCVKPGEIYTFGEMHDGRYSVRAQVTRNAACREPTDCDIETANEGIAGGQTHSLTLSADARACRWAWGLQ
jgi:hypothetical protein